MRSGGPALLHRQHLPVERGLPEWTVRHLWCGGAALLCEQQLHPDRHQLPERHLPEPQPPIEIPPITVPPITIPPIAVPGLPPITIPPVAIPSIPPVQLPPL